MSTRPTPLDDRLWSYLCRVSLRESPLLAELRAETAEMPSAQCQISPEQGQFMALLVRLIGARRALEVGTFTGYSSLSVALALPDDGCLLCCDVSEEWTSVARRYWEKAGVAHKIGLRLGPALQTLEAMASNGEKGSIDFAFVDADKTGYRDYYELCLKLLRPGGLVLFDNMLWEGKVADPHARDEDTRAIRELNELASRDERVASSLLQVGDGVLLAMKL
jgi:predicted O-methyltransferase YrrM